MTTPVGSGRAQIDPRGPRFGAVITTVVVAGALVTQGTVLGDVLVFWQLLVFALGAFAGLGAQPYGVVFRVLIRPQLAPPSELEDAAPPRFAQLCGFVFLALAAVGVLIGASLLVTVALAFALAASFLNAAFDFCIGCELYLLGKRTVSR